MKEAFDDKKVKTAEWINADDPLEIGWFKDEGRVIVKPRFGSRGRGLQLLSSLKELEKWSKGRDKEEYIIEKYYGYDKEYRLHVTEKGCFYACRKMLKKDTPEDKRFYRNDSNCVWVLDSNPDFDTPTSWSAIQAECVKALKAVGLDFGACDVRVQKNLDGKGKPRKEVKFIVVEINSAPSFGEITLEKYLEILPTMLRVKFNNTKK